MSNRRHIKTAPNDPVMSMPVESYVEVFDSGAWGRGVIRAVSGDSRIVYAEITGSEGLWRFSPDEVRIAEANDNPCAAIR